MVEKQGHTHPFLEGSKSGKQQNAVLYNTNAEFPVRSLIEDPPSTVQADASMNKTQTRNLSEQDAREDISMAGLETLSPFAQWLISLSPPAYQGDGTVRAFNQLPEQPLAKETVQEKPEKKKKKKKKKKKGRKKMKKARRKEAKDTILSPALDNDIVTDTLAELTASQGYTEEAILMYRKLIDLQPEKAAHYEQRIAQLKGENES